MKKSSPSLWRTLGKIALVVAIIIVYAFGLQVTKVDLEKPQEAKRQEQLTNILRGLAHPDLFSYDTEHIVANAPIIVPCTGTPPAVPPAAAGQPSIALSSNCAAPGDKITVSGSGFGAGENVFIFFVPFAPTVKDEVQLKLADSTVTTAADGTFSKEITLKTDRDSENVQTVRAVVNRRSGMPRPSEALKQTWEKIVETVFLAFIATTFGVILAVPISFLAARNLMLQVTTNFTRFMASMVIMPIGAYIGYIIFVKLSAYGAQLVGAGAAPPGDTLLWTALPLVGLAVAQASGRRAFWKAVQRWLGSIVAAVVIVVALAALGQLGRAAGVSLKTSLGGWSFFGNFILIFSDAIVLGLPAFGALVGMFALNPLANRILEPTLPKLPKVTRKIIAVMLATLTGAIAFGIVTAILDWFYEFGALGTVIILPVIIGAVLFAALAFIVDPDREITTGMFVYYGLRTIMNTFRSIEPLVMVVAFAVWVGIGPFAGVMALGLHTIVSLGKLFSEQVENIATGPIEAITATGANRLQTIIYAVIPQIVPPYIAFTLYRWDINVRMSTIIGFGGGGGIGFLLSQNINLLKYRQASVNMIAIAIVVASLDYISAKVREKIT